MLGSVRLSQQSKGAVHSAHDHITARPHSAPGRLDEVSRRLYHREWAKRHPGYKTADSRLRALFRPAKRPFFREILGVKVRVNLLALGLVQKQRKGYL